jgi:predicted CXXCH cytochrome family protein
MPTLRDLQCTPRSAPPAGTLQELTVASFRSRLARRGFAIALVFLAGLASAGDWHTGNALPCSDCHTQHNSENGAPMRTDNNPNAAPLLLRRGTPLELCLSCHDGSNPFAPDVVSPVGYITDPAAGAFPNSGGVPTTMAHHLNNPTAEVPPGGTIAMVLNCTTCHDPHGNANYRNLRPDPTQTAQPPVTVSVSQTTIANGTNPASVYVPSNIIYKSGVSAWCIKCHGAPQPGDHPDDRTIFGAVSADYAVWVGVTLPRVPVHSPADNAIPSQDDAVICLSCHKAHGSSNWKTLIYADGMTMDSTCQECHNQ